MSWRLEIWPDRAQYRPGEPVRLQAEVTGPPDASAYLRLQLTEGMTRLDELGVPVRTDGQGRARVEVGWAVPTGVGSGGYESWPAFGADGTLFAPDSEADEVARASTAFDMAPHWSKAPRYGAMTDFGPGDANRAHEAANALLRLHVNCVQFYDWAYRHHTYIPNEPEYVDAMGRRLSLASVQARVDACRARGMAPLAYAAAYGAEEPFAGEHPDWLLYDGGRKPMSLGGLFFIQDVSVGSGWRCHLMREYRRAMEVLGFAGFHVDTYGSPRAGLVRRPGQGDGWAVVRMDEHLPGLAAEADALARSLDPWGGAMLNCVNAWPLEATARVSTACFYVEVWPPNTTYRDLYELVMRARRLDPGRQVILAAYLPGFGPEQERDERALQGLKLAAASVFASGGFYLLPVESAGVLTGPYYPRYGLLTSAEQDALRRYWDFQTRYGPWLADPKAADVTTTHAGEGARECRLRGPQGVEFSPLAEPGKIWTLLKQGRRYMLLHLINLTTCKETDWRSPKPLLPSVEGIEVRLEVVAPVRAVGVASPDRNGGRMERLSFETEYEAGVGLVLRFAVPRVDTWSMVLVEQDA